MNIVFETKSFFIDLYLFIVKMYMLLIWKFRLKLAIKMADMKHAISDKRYYVIPNVLSGGLLVKSTKEIKIERKKKKNSLFKKSDDHLKIMSICFYATPLNRAQSQRLSPEQKLLLAKRYIKWKKQLHPFINKLKFGSPVLKDI